MICKNLTCKLFFLNYQLFKEFLMTKTYCVASIWEKEIYLLIFCSKIINLKCPIA